MASFLFVLSTDTAIVLFDTEKILYRAFASGSEGFHFTTPPIATSDEDFWTVRALKWLKEYGVGVLSAGLAKVQFTFDMIRQKNKKWFFALIGAAISIVCAIIILNNPFATTAVLWIFTGISLIVEAVFDAVTLIVSRES